MRAILSRVWPILKWLLFAVVLAFVVRDAYKRWQQLSAEDLATVHLRPGWLMAAAGCYFAGWLPSVWFWRRLMSVCGSKVTWRDATRAYYAGHLGKYVPGKAVVLVIRSAMLRHAHVPVAIAALTVAYETLTYMGAGLAITIALAPLTISEPLWAQLPTGLRVLRTRPGLLPAIVYAGILLSLPMLSTVYSFVAGKLLPAQATGELRSRPAITSNLLLQGLAIICLGWLLHTASLACTLAALRNTPLPADCFPTLLAATTLSNVGGFLMMFAPGGIGPREALLEQVLSPMFPGPESLFAPFVLRAVWLGTEVLAAAVLTRLGPSPTGSTPTSAPASAADSPP